MAISHHLAIMRSHTLSYPHSIIVIGLGSSEQAIADVFTLSLPDGLQARNASI
jgi:hypothetical protein